MANTHDNTVTITRMQIDAATDLGHALSTMARKLMDPDTGENDVAALIAVADVLNTKLRYLSHAIDRIENGDEDDFANGVNSIAS